MHLVLSTPEDHAARWAYDGLAERGLDPIELVTSQQLAYGRAWDHQIGSVAATVSVLLGDGRTIQSKSIRSVFNRLVAPPFDLVNLGNGADREYAMQELSAFYLSWLRALSGKTIGRPTPGGLCGRWRHISEWAVLAQRAGLRAPAYRQSASQPAMMTALGLAPPGKVVRTAVALGGKLFGEVLPEDVASACLRLADLAESDLLGLFLFIDCDGEWSFSGATPCPDIRTGGAPLLDHLCHLLTKGGEA